MAERGMAMINNISEAPLRMAAKVDSGGAIQEKQVNVQKAEEIRQVRPVEKSEAGGKSEKKKAKTEEDTSKYVVDNNQVVFEKYDSNGDLILRIPPSYKPVDERV
jgi:hypothetical protein